MTAWYSGEPLAGQAGRSSIDIRRAAAHWSGVANAGDRLRQLRESKGWTQEEVAAKLGVSLMTVSRWERGEHDPTRHAAKLADLYGRSADWILRGVAEPATTEDRDDARSPYPEVEELIADEVASGRAISEEHLAELRALRLYRSTVLSPYDTAASLLAQLRARERGKALPRRPVRR